MREKWESLNLSDLREIAKNAGVKGCSSLKKDELVDILDRMESEMASGRDGSAASKATDESKTAEPSEKKSGRGRTKKTTDKAAKKDADKPNDETAEKAEKSGDSGSEKNKTEEIKTAGRKRIDKGTESKPSENRSAESKPAENRSVEKNGINNSQAPVEESKPVPGKTRDNRGSEGKAEEEDNTELDSKIPAHGILEVMGDGYGFIRCENYLPGEHDVYVSPSQIRKFGLKTGDIIDGSTKIKTAAEKFSALLFVKKINGYAPEEAVRRFNFEDMTPIFPDEKIRLDIPGAPLSMRIMDLMSPVGKGQRGMIVSPPKAGKTTLLKAVAKCVKYSNPDMHMIILLIDERPEEVTDIKEAIMGDNVEVIYSTFDETPEHHKRVAEMVIERAKRLVEHKQDVIILLDSITRLTRAYNQVIPPSGRTLSGGLDPAALHMPKRFFGAARNMREGGSLTILATALVDTGSKMDDVVYEEFKGTGNMEMVLDRKLSEKRVFPAIDILKSGTRREDLLLKPEELESINNMRKAFNSLKPEEATDRVIDTFSKTRNNAEFVEAMKKIKLY